ncbi:MAG: thiaminase II [Magnetovibrionaceae bacterium]
MSPAFCVESPSALTRLIASCPGEWRAYTDHAFVQGLGDGTLPEGAFRHYLVQDYVFLFHFCRAWALAAAKTDNLADMRACTAVLDGILNTEMDLHVSYCADWGIDASALENSREEAANMAYTRFVLDWGQRGDLLDLVTALAPCVFGYQVIGEKLMDDSATKKVGNRYMSWIEMYGGEDYAEAISPLDSLLERLVATKLGPDPEKHPRWPQLARIFADATRLEAGFWDMGLEGT